MRDEQVCILGDGMIVMGVHSAESEGPKAELSQGLVIFSALKQAYKASIDTSWLRRRSRRQPDEEIQERGSESSSAKI